jgi:hypothetical protein
MHARIRGLCGLVRAREIELGLPPAPPAYSLCLHGEFDGYGDYFSVLVAGVRYIEFSPGIVVGEMLFAADARELLGRFPRWKALAAEFAEQALVVLPAEDTLKAPSDSLGQAIVVAERIDVVEGKDWAKIFGAPLPTD